MDMMCRYFSPSTLVLWNIVLVRILQPGSTPLQLGVCSPKQCTPEDLSQLYNISVKDATFSVTCQSQDYKLPPGSIAAL